MPMMIRPKGKARKIAARILDVPRPPKKTEKERLRDQKIMSEQISFVR